MKVERSTELAGSVAEVVALMTSEDFQRRKAERIDTIDFGFASTPSADGATVVVTTRVLPTSGLPEFVKAMVKPTMTVTETEHWQPETAGGTRAGSFDVDVDGAPVQMRGDVRVEETPGGSRITFTGEWSSTVPLFKSKVEELSVHSMFETIDAEFAQLAEELATLRAS